MEEGNHLLVSLYEALDRDPSSVYVLERLLEAWKEIGDKDMVSGIVSALIRIEPNNGAAQQHLQGRQGGTSDEPSSAQSAVFGHSERMDQDTSSAEESLEEGYRSLKFVATLLQEEIQGIHALAEIPLEDDKLISNLQAISEGRVSTVVPMLQMRSVRETARAIMATPKTCQESIVEDFTALVNLARSQDPPLEPDAIRERLIKRKTLLEAALPDSMQRFSAAALTIIEREHLQKKYVNSESMLGDKIEDIPKRNFFVSEDNYAFDMEELAQAIASNDGVMRNPLSRQIFSDSDIRMILAHQLGQRLKPLQMAQNRLKKGIRPSTIDQIGKLGRIMLAEQSIDAAPSRAAMDEFQAYVATVPEVEQNTINSLKIPARDRHNGQPFDYTIGQSVRDAKTNSTCYHKVGDFLCQAAAYLERQ